MPKGIFLSAATALTLSALLSGCGLIYTDVRVPRSYRSATASDVKAGANDAVVTGESCNRSVLALVAWGNGGYAGAVKNALRDHPDSVLYDVQADTRVTSILGFLYSKNCTTVTGKLAAR